MKIQFEFGEEREEEEKGAAAAALVVMLLLFLLACLLAHLILARGEVASIERGGHGGDRHGALGPLLHRPAAGTLHPGLVQHLVHHEALTAVRCGVSSNQTNQSIHPSIHKLINQLINQSRDRDGDRDGR